MTQTVFELRATSQVSYYNKALVLVTPDTIYLQSYNTIVCAIDKQSGAFYRMWDGYSNTTKKHVNDFRKLFELPTLSKKEWLALPVVAHYDNDVSRIFHDYENAFVNNVWGGYVSDYLGKWERVKTQGYYEV